MTRIPRVKIASQGDDELVEYTSSHWELLSSYRQTAKTYMKSLKNFVPIIHGSLARGDISKTSDIDIFIPQIIAEYQLIFPLESLNKLPLSRRIIQATPNALVKAHLEYPENVTITYPLIPYHPRELDFYYYGGAITYDELKEKRVPGVNKALQLIRPIPKGHEATSIFSHPPSYISKILGISLDMVNERIRVLSRRNEIGRTGVFYNCQLKPDESFGQALLILESTNPAARRRIRT